jgi:quercetin dioxygenase-like cupin family protein
MTDIRHHFGGGVYIKETHIPAGCVLVQHKHRYDHLTVLVSGLAIVDGEEKLGPQIFVIPAEQNHGARTITDCVWLCVHATEERDPDKVDEVLIFPQDAAEMFEVARKL